MKRLLLALMLLSIPTCGTTAPARAAECLDPVMNEVIFDMGLEPLYTFPEVQAERVQQILGTHPEVDWTSIDVLYKPGSDDALVVLNGRLPGSKQICMFDYSTGDTIKDVENLINALENEHDD